MRRAVILLVLILAGILALGSATVYKAGFLENSELESNSTVYVSEWNNDTWVKEEEFDDKNTSTHIVEVNRYPNATPTEKQIEQSWQLYNQTYENAEEEGWFQIMNAARDGYYNWRSDKIHYPNNQYLFDNQTLNTEKPEFLIYENRKNSPKVQLVGAMYTTQEKGVHGPQVGGPITVWHHHPTRYRCYAGKVFPLKISNAENCVYGEMGWKTPEMLHVWFVDHPKNQFATNMSIDPDLVKGKPEKMSKSEFTSKIEQRYSNRTQK
jgi:hypothetical protein